MDIKKVVEKQEICNDNEEAVRSEKETKKLVPKQFHKQIKIFGKKMSERMLTRKIQDYAIKLKKEFVPRKEKIYLLFKEEREEVREFIQKQTEKRYIRPSKLLQTVLVFFVRKKNGKKKIVQDYQYLNE